MYQGIAHAVFHYSQLLWSLLKLTIPECDFMKSLNMVSCTFCHCYSNVSERQYMLLNISSVYIAEERSQIRSPKSFSLSICYTLRYRVDLRGLVRTQMGASQMFQLLPHSPCHLAPPGPRIQCQVERPPHSITIRAWNESSKAGSCPFLCSVFIAIAAEIIRCLFQGIISCLFILAI